MVHSEQLKIVVPLGQLVLATSRRVVVYDTDGNFVHSFGEDMHNSSYITVCNDGDVLDLTASCVRIFSDEGDYLNKFQLQSNDCIYSSITFHPGGEHVVIAGCESEKNLLHVEIYAKDGEFVRSAQIQIDGICEVRDIIVTNDRGTHCCFN